MHMLSSTRVKSRFIHFIILSSSIRAYNIFIILCMFINHHNIIIIHNVMQHLPIRLLHLNPRNT